MLWVTFIWVMDSHQRADARKANSIGISEFTFADVWEGRARIPWIARMMAFARGRASLAGTGYLGALPWRREQTYNLLSTSRGVHVRGSGHIPNSPVVRADHL